MSAPERADAVTSIRDVDHLEDLLSEPSPGVVQTLGQLDGDILILGVGGKMGPSLARMARRASDLAGVRRRVIGVSRFSSATLPDQLNGWGVETVPADLLDPDALARLPDAPNVVFMAGMKFGSTGQQARTWAMNTFLPGLIARRFARSRIVAFSTGNFYPLAPVQSGGAIEGDEPAPIGEYAMSCLGRERILEHFSRTLNTPMALIRLNYATEMRYGTLVDIAARVRDGKLIDLTMGNFNAIWQADANAHALQAFDHVSTPPTAFNVTGPETLSVRRVADTFAALMGGTQVQFEGTPAPTALLSNAQLSHCLFGYPRVPIEQVIRWTAEWVSHGGASLGKPTGFQTRDGQF